MFPVRSVIAPRRLSAPRFKIHRPGSNLADGALLEVAAVGELVLDGSSGNIFGPSE